MYIEAYQYVMTNGAPVGYVRVSFSAGVVSFKYWVNDACSITGVDLYARSTHYL